MDSNMSPKYLKHSITMPTLYVKDQGGCSQKERALGYRGQTEIGTYQLPVVEMNNWKV